VSGGVIQAAVCWGAVLLGIALGYYAGTQRQPPRHGSTQLRAPRHRRKGSEPPATTLRAAPVRAHRPVHRGGTDKRFRGDE